MQITKASSNLHTELTILTKASKAYWGFSQEILDQWKDLLTISPKYIEENEVYCLWQEDELVGYYSYFFSDKNTIHLDNLFILPEYIGKGLGKKMMLDFLEKVTQLTEGKYLTLDSEPKAQIFYEKFGFVVYGQEPTAIPGRFLPKMKKKI